MTGTLSYLYFGDNLDVLRRHIADGSVDLVYLDPPFNSNVDYNGGRIKRCVKREAPYDRAWPRSGACDGA